MNNSLSTWKLVQQNLRQSIAVVLLYVLESKGSSPGRQGFFMAVNEQGVMEGSIGGGIMEHKFVEMAKEKLRIGKIEPGVRKQIHDKLAAKDQSGMICSGEQTILVYPLKESDKETIDRLISSLENYRNGTLHFFPSGFAFHEESSANNFEFQYEDDQHWSYKEKTGYKNFLSIIGGGHCSLALSQLMRNMDFYVTVYDDRENLKTMMTNDAAHKKEIIGSYHELGQYLREGEDQYVVIMTFGYRTDDLALRATLHHDFKYLGVLGSKHKMEKLFDEYVKEGISKTRLQRIFTPIGLDINSQTPEEIAISIAAEIIKVKNSS